jgi:hypothetical protein
VVVCVVISVDTVVGAVVGFTVATLGAVVETSFDGLMFGAPVRASTGSPSGAGIIEFEEDFTIIVDVDNFLTAEG